MLPQKKGYGMSLQVLPRLVVAAKGTRDSLVSASAVKLKSSGIRKTIGKPT